MTFVGNSTPKAQLIRRGINICPETEEILIELDVRLALHELILIFDALLFTLLSPKTLDTTKCVQGVECTNVFEELPTRWIWFIFPNCYLE